MHEHRAANRINRDGKKEREEQIMRAFLSSDKLVRIRINWKNAESMAETVRGITWHRDEGRQMNDSE